MRLRNVLLFLFVVLAVADLGMSGLALWKAGHIEHEINPFVVLLGAPGFLLVVAVNVALVFVILYHFKKQSHSVNLMFALTCIIMLLSVARVVMVGNAWDAYQNPPSVEQVRAQYTSQDKVEEYANQSFVLLVAPLLFMMVCFWLFRLDYDIVKKGRG